MSKTKLKYLDDKDPWILAEDIPDADPFFSQIWASCFVNELLKPGGIKYKKVLFIHRGLHLWFYYGKEDSFKVGEYLAKKFFNNPRFTVRINREIISWSNKLRAAVNSIPVNRLKELSNKQLWQQFRKHDIIHTKYYQWGWIPVAVDMFHNNLTNRLQQHLRTKVTEDKVNEYLVVLTQPRKKSLIQIEQEEFLKIAKAIYQDKKQKRLFKSVKKSDELLKKIKPLILVKIKKHHKKYFYVKHMWLGKEGVYTLDHYIKELVKIIRSGVDPGATLKKMERDFKDQVSKREKLIKKLKIRNPWLTLFNSWGDFMVTKIYRRYAQIYAVYRMQPVLKEIAKRLGVSLKEVRFMLKSEMRRALLTGKVNRSAIRKRFRFSIFYYEQGKEVVFVGPKAKSLAKKAISSAPKEIKEFKGQVGCVGKAKGAVKIIIRPKDMVKMKQGDILVSIATDPDIVPAMKKAAAIVAEQGGVTSHAAIVSRELGIPCVIGTKIATRVLKDGDKVEVDANKGIIRKLK